MEGLSLHSSTNSQCQHSYPGRFNSHSLEAIDKGPTGYAMSDSCWLIMTGWITDPGLGFRIRIFGNDRDFGHRNSKFAPTCDPCLSRSSGTKALGTLLEWGLIKKQQQKSFQHSASQAWYDIHPDKCLILSKNMKKGFD